MRCWVKSRNERNPCSQLPAHNGGHSEETAGDKPEEGGDDVKSSWPLRLGLHTCYNGRYNELQCREVGLISESRSQFGLESQLDSMKSESLVIAYQLRRGEYVPGPCTHRPSHDPSRVHPKSPIQPFEEESA